MSDIENIDLSEAVQALKKASDHLHQVRCSIDKKSMHGDLDKINLDFTRALIEITHISINLKKIEDWINTQVYTDCKSDIKH